MPVYVHVYAPERHISHLFPYLLLEKPSESIWRLSFYLLITDRLRVDTGRRAVYMKVNTPTTDARPPPTPHTTQALKDISIRIGENWYWLEEWRRRRRQQKKTLTQFRWALPISWSNGKLGARGGRRSGRNWLHFPRNWLECRYCSIYVGMRGCVVT